MRVISLFVGVGLALLPIRSGEAADGVQVRFAFGKIEVLRSGASGWVFLGKGAQLDRDDLVRMPPVSLLRAMAADGTEYGLLAGAHEAPVRELLARSQSEERGAGSRRLGPNTGEVAVVDVLPAGDRTARRGPTAPMRLSQAGLRKWRNDDRHAHPLVRAAAQDAVGRAASRAAGRPYPTPRLLQVQALYAVGARAVSERAAVASLFAADDAPLLYLVTALLRAAEIPIHPTVGKEQRPVLLVELDVDVSESRRVTANRDLYRIGSNGRVLIPLLPEPDASAFLDAWFAGEAAALPSTSR
jgi:hypothetical protein